MDLYLVRHSIAEPGHRKNDFDRELTFEGVARASAVGEGMRSMGVVLDRLYHSPLVRAVQTAEHLAGLCLGEVVSLDALADPPTAGLLAALSGERIALVGHQPNLGQLASWLIAGDGRLAGQLIFEPGTVAWLMGPPKPGAMGLRALLPAEAFTAMGAP